MALNFPFNTRYSNEQLKNVLLLFGFQDKCPIEFVLSRTFVLLQSKWKWAPDLRTSLNLVTMATFSEILLKQHVILREEIPEYPHHTLIN